MLVRPKKGGVVLLALATLGALFPGACATGINRPKNPPARLDPAVAEVVLLGGMHGYHKGHPRYPTSRVAEILDKLHPSLVLIEWSVNRFQDGKPLDETLKFLEETTGSEDEVAWSYSKRSGATCLPYDIAKRDKFYRDNKFFEREKPFYQAIWNELMANYPLLDLGVHQHFAIKAICRDSAAEVVNSALCDKIVETDHEFRSQVVELVSREKDIPDEEFGQMEREEWSRRNRAMAENICQAAQGRLGQRIVVTMGYEHRYALKKLLSETCKVARVREFWEILGE